MTKEAQIAEIRKICGSCEDVPITQCPPVPCEECQAQRIYQAGYRKQTHAKWETTVTYNTKSLNTYIHKCPSCNYFYKTVSPLGFDYCPKCGAKMDGKKD